MRREIDIRREDIASPAAATLIAALNRELSETYADVEDATHFRLDAAEVESGRGAFVVGYVDEKPVACGAIRLIEPGIAEVKRMFVVPARRGDGLGRSILRALEAEARTLGARQIVLETGTRQAAAVALYEKEGFVPIARYGEYIHTPATSICFGKTLT